MSYKYWHSTDIQLTVNTDIQLTVNVNVTWKWKFLLRQHDDSLISVGVYV